MPEKKEKQDYLQHCPSCGNSFTPWQKVLLKVDRELICKKCWKKIILLPSGEKLSSDTGLTKKQNK
ncbi:MAG: hypothetical protein GXX85_09900 [Ignavibacteria bacterium]|nr:hypothetical protein [Ignavibacteria bacterium]